jgi:hypothetical protein
MRETYFRATLTVTTTRSKFIRIPSTAVWAAAQLPHTDDMVSKLLTSGLAETLGGVLLGRPIRTGAHTRYRSEHSTLYKWGYGCGRCPGLAS